MRLDVETTGILMDGSTHRSLRASIWRMYISNVALVYQLMYVGCISHCG